MTADVATGVDWTNRATRRREMVRETTWRGRLRRSSGPRWGSPAAGCQCCPDERHIREVGERVYLYALIVRQRVAPGAMSSAVAARRPVERTNPFRRSAYRAVAVRARRRRASCDLRPTSVVDSNVSGSAHPASGIGARVPLSYGERCRHREDCFAVLNSRDAASREGPSVARSVDEVHDLVLGATRTQEVAVQRGTTRPESSTVLLAATSLRCHLASKRALWSPSVDNVRVKMSRSTWSRVSRFTKSSRSWSRWRLRLDSALRLGQRPVENRHAGIGNRLSSPDEPLASIVRRDSSPSRQRQAAAIAAPFAGILRDLVRESGAFE